MYIRMCNCCKGKGRILCTRCEGSRLLCNELCYNCKDGTEPCPACKGSGKISRA